MRFHVVGLPHTEVMQEYNQCAYTAKIRKFVDMMVDRGHEVILYSSGQHETRATEWVRIFNRKEFRNQFRGHAWWEAKEWFGLDWNPAQPYWMQFNGRVISELQKRLGPQDFICLISGTPYQSIVDSFPQHISVEYGIGYEGVYSQYRVYESYAWMHMLYGQQGPSGFNGRFFDAVIPNYFDPDEFPMHTGSGDYLLFMSRMTPRKGYQIAIELAERVGTKLVVAGTGGDKPTNDCIEYVGFADAETRGTLMKEAKALICPTLYIEPFGGVVAESMLCGTPVLTTDFGAFTETVRMGVDGYRCRTMAEFEQGYEALDLLDPPTIRSGALGRFSTEVVGLQYELHFERLLTLWGDGFYERL
jgi:glycosyltransferase involved in cell wall biosynthesis